MINFRCSGDPLGDCTQAYEVELDKTYNVKEFIDTIVKERAQEYGMFHIKIGDTLKLSYGVSYSKGKLKRCNIPQDILASEVKEVKAHGGWTIMDYKIKV